MDQQDTTPSSSQLSISDHDFKQLGDLIYKQFGIHLPDSKRTLLARRLRGLLKEHNFTFQKYYDYLVNHPSDVKFTELVNRITTNYTFFNREPDHFDFFTRTVLPELTRTRTAANDCDLRIWCAAASTGEEPYMLAMLMMEYLGSSYMLWDAGVLATDLSKKALTKAVVGQYKEKEFGSMPRHLLKKYFTLVGPGIYEVKRRLKQELTYRCFNLISPVYPFKQPFDVVFCRNVLIYFDKPTTAKVIHSLHASLSPGGYLFIGHSESIKQHSQIFKYIMPAVYRKI